VAKGRFLIETHLRTGKPIGELAAAHSIHRSWLYKVGARHWRKGEANLTSPPGARTGRRGSRRNRG
jgi:hypothetical protein